MARPRPRRIDPVVVQRAQMTAAATTSVESLRQCQAVLLPALFGATLEQTAAVPGVSRATVPRLQAAFRQPPTAGAQPNRNRGARPAASRGGQRLRTGISICLRRGQPAGRGTGLADRPGHECRGDGSFPGAGQCRPPGRLHRHGGGRGQLACRQGAGGAGEHSPAPPGRSTLARSPVRHLLRRAPGLQPRRRGLGESPAPAHALPAAFARQRMAFAPPLVCHHGLRRPAGRGRTPRAGRHALSRPRRPVGTQGRTLRPSALTLERSLRREVRRAAL